MTMTVSLGDPSDRDVTRMIAQSDRYYAGLYPAQSNHLLDMATLLAPNVSFYVAREADTVVGFGAIVASPPYGEIKRMYVEPAVRGRGVGRKILAEIERRARELRLTHLRLETGIRQREAIALYATHGFCEIGPFGDYAPDPLSLFMEKALN